MLIDIERHLARHGRRLDYRSGEPIAVETVDLAAQEQGVVFRSGDILMLRTGWMAAYFNEFSTNDRAGLPQNMRAPGLRQGHDTLAWIWNHQFAICACDNFGLECHPPIMGTAFSRELTEKEGVHPRHCGMMHSNLIALLGVVIGEQWALDELAEDCARDGVWECLLTVKPLNLVGGVGSPANAIAVK